MILQTRLICKTLIKTDLKISIVISLKIKEINVNYFDRLILIINFNEYIIKL